MPKAKPSYGAEYRAQIVELVRSGRTPESLAQEYEPSAQTIRNWVHQADEELRRLRRLRREVRVLR